jgi:hypothetical protein
VAGKGKGKSPSENLGELLKEFGDAVSKIFDDPELKKKAKDFGDSAVKSAKLFGKRFKDEEVKSKFKDVGKAAQDFGNSVSDYFKEGNEAGTEEPDSKKKDDWEKKLDQKMDQFSRKAEEAGEKFGRKAEEAGKEFGKKMEKMGERVDHHFKGTRGGRITGYAFSIFWSSLILVLFNFYSHYIAIYDHEMIDGVRHWTSYPLLTSDFGQWLPIVTVALIAAIIGNIILVIYDSYFFRQVIHISIDLFSLAATISLLVIFPFDFSVMPGNDLTNLLNPIITVVLILVSVGMGIGIIVRFVKLMVAIVKRP